MSSPLNSLSESDKIRIKSLIEEGERMLSDIAVQRESLKDAVTAIAEELNVKKSVLNKAIQIAYKNSQNTDKLTEAREELDEVEMVLMMAGRA